VDATSYFRARATVSATSPRVVIRWEAVPGRGYRVQFKTNISDPVWNFVTGGVSVNGSQAIFVDNTTEQSSQRFYRVLLME